MCIYLRRAFVLGLLLDLTYFCHAQVIVDTVNPISQGENSYNYRRASYLCQGMQAFLGIPIPSGANIPVASICDSGGGYRSMISCAGGLAALESIGLLPAVTNISSLSGSCWMLGHMLVRDCCYAQPLTMQEFGQVLKQRVVNVPFFDVKTIHWEAVLEKLAQTYKNTGTVQMADFWGAILTDRLMGDLQEKGYPVQNITFSDVQEQILNRSFKYPFPIFTSSITDVLPYWLIEINPYVSGSDYLMYQQYLHMPKQYWGAYVPTYALGSLFSGGLCTQLVAEKSVGSVIGICGSPYSMSLADMIKFAAQYIDNYIANKVPDYAKRRALEFAISALTQYFCIEHKLNEPRFLPSRVNNFVYGMTSFLAQLPTLSLSDAGFAYNDPVLPLLKRGSDVIIIFEASSDADWKDHPEIYRTRDAAWSHGFKFPSLTTGRKVNDHLIVYQDSDPAVPIVVYFVNSVVEATLKFDYTSDEYDQLYDFMYSLVLQYQDELRSVIMTKYMQKNPSYFIPVYFMPVVQAYPQRQVDPDDGIPGWMRRLRDGINNLVQRLDIF